MTRASAFGVLLLTAMACDGSSRVPDAHLQIWLDGKQVRDLSLREIATQAPPSRVTTDDPYYRKTKHFFAVKLSAVLDTALAGVDMSNRQLVFRAKDGYRVPLDLARAKEPGAWLAYADADVAGYDPIGPQHVDPFPLYLIWSEPGQNDLEGHPRPWQLDAIELTNFELAYPHTVPPTLADAEQDRRVRDGYATFRRACFKCHAVNREGGKVGPELNVPQNVFEYLPADYIRSYVKNPAQFRYGVMPAHLDMPDAELDALLAYVRSMQASKHDLP